MEDEIRPPAKARFLCLGKLRQARNHDKLSRAASTQKLIAPSIAESNNVTVLRPQARKRGLVHREKQSYSGTWEREEFMRQAELWTEFTRSQKKENPGHFQALPPMQQPFCVINRPSKRRGTPSTSSKGASGQDARRFSGHMDFHWNFHTAGEATSYVHTKLLTATLLQQPERPAQCFWSTSRKCCKMVSCELRRPSCFLVSASVCHLSTCAHVRKALSLRKERCVS